MAVHLNQQECFKKYNDMWISAHLKISLDDQNKLPDLKKKKKKKHYLKEALEEIQH